MSITSTRPELACEIVPEGVIAARRQPGSGLLASAAFAAFGKHGPTAVFAPYLDKDAPRVGLPGMQTGNPQQREAVVQTVRRALESVGGKGGVLTLVIPDQAVRVLMMDFDSLPGKAADVIPLLKFRLKKMVPFDVDDSAVSYQALPAKSGARAMVAVLPNAVLREYETVVREAGYEPGIVMPSTLACLGMLTEGDATLLVHSSTQCVTTAIASGEELMLHRTQELPWAQEELAQTMNPTVADETHTLYDETHTTYHEEMPQPVETRDLMTNAELSEAIDQTLYPSITPDEGEAMSGGEPEVEWRTFEQVPAAETARGTEIAPQVPAELQVSSVAQLPKAEEVQTEMHHALAVAAAYFEDAIGCTPSPVLVAGAMDARGWAQMMGEEGVTLRDLVTLEDMGTAIDSGLSRAQLGAVCGALRG
jgi:type IV pilus assembly protein PilM